MPIYIEFRDAVKFTDFARQSGVFESLMTVIDALDEIQMMSNSPVPEFLRYAPHA